MIDPKYDLGIVYLTNMRHSLYINGNFEGTNYLWSDFGNVISLIYDTFITNQMNVSKLDIFIF